MAKVWLNLFNKPSNTKLDQQSPGAVLVKTGVYPGSAFFASKDFADAVLLLPEIIDHNNRYGVIRLGCIEVDVPDELLNG